MTHVRRAAVAGSWYPADPEVLAREVDRYLAGAEAPPNGEPLAIIAPHAGLMYSGPIAAHAYKLLHGRDIEVAVLVGPSHYVGFEGVAIYERGAFDTPFGRIPIAEQCAASIATGSPLIAPHPTAHGREHSLEMQLPFLAHLLPDVPIVPMVMGDQDRETAFALGDALASAIANRTVAEGTAGRVLLIASSDLSHYEDASTAQTMDAVVLREVERLDPDGLMRALEREPHHACGGGPIVAVLHAARRLGATRGRVLKYGDSGDVSGDKSSVVGYMAAGIW